MIESERYRPAIDRIATLASRLAQVIDVPSAEELAAVFGDAGWVTERPGRFTADQLAAAVFTGWGTTAIYVDLDDFGSPDDVNYDDYDTDEAYYTARDQLYLAAETAMQAMAQLLGLPPADPLAIDDRADYPQRIRLRSGHWAVTVAVVHEDPDLPIILEVSLAYGADLPGRLAQLVGHPPAPAPVDWDAISARIGIDMPDDYRWLMDTYRPGAFDDHLTLIAPTDLPSPQPGPLTTTGSWHQTLPLATTPDGAAVSAICQPGWTGLKITAPGKPDHDLSVSLLQFLVVLLSGTDRLPHFRSGFLNMTPPFRAADRTGSDNHSDRG